MVCISSSSRISSGGDGGSRTEDGLCRSARHECGGGDPLVVLGLDLFFTEILPLLDAPSLAACVAVCSTWRACCTSDILWQPLLSGLLSQRAHLPLPLLRRSSPLSPYVAFSITMLDASKVELSAREMCARIWEIKVKPTCGPYWYSLDPTSRGEEPLLRRFQCDYSVTPMQDMDPIWGGQESTWQFVKLKNSDGKPAGQYVRINSWPQHRVLRLPDGRWHLDNYYASYTTCPDQEQNMVPYVRTKKIGLCPKCNPEPAEKVQKERTGCKRKYSNLRVGF